MKSNLCVAGAVLACVGCAHQPPPAPPLTARPTIVVSRPLSSEVRVAAALLDALARQDWNTAAATFNAKVAKALPVALLAGTWTDLLSTQGAWVGVDRYLTEPKPPFTVVLADARFARRRQRLRVTVDRQGKVAGLLRGPVPEEIEQDARAIVHALAHGDGVGASRLFNVSMRAALSVDKVLAAWKSVEEMAGTFRAIETTRLDEDAKYVVALVRCRMQRAAIVAKIVFDPNGDVAGLSFLPVGADAAWTPPDYGKAPDVEEREVQVGSAPILPGTLTVPKRAHRVAAVVLVHGSGPADRDESVGGTKVFRDLALGLAARGVAVLRYDKRSRVQPRGIITSKEEVIDGALAAIGLLRNTAEVDPERIVVIGHSQGGALSPRIAQTDGRLAGIVVMAGPTRPVEQMLVAQIEYLRSLGGTDDSIAGLLNEARRFRALVESPSLRPEVELQMPGGGTLPGAYFLDLRGYHPEQAAASLPCPVLILQGGRDYQVMRDDLEGWRRAVAGNPRASVRSYATLDHRFVAGEGPSSPAQYEQPDHVALQVVEDVAVWVNSLPRALRR